MNTDRLLSVWSDFLAFMDRVVQWLQYVFGIRDTWPPEDYPDFDATNPA
ncbi:MAG: hypothetical protein ACI4GB_03990 [Acutalibacteraceae bacterium]